jgi:hypothetical protein
MTLANTDPMLGTLLLDAIAGVVVFVALVRIAITPAELWGHGRWSKMAWAIAAIWFITPVGGVAIPVAAVAAIVHTRRITRAALDRSSQQQGIPFAAGEPERTDGTGASGGSK